MNSYLCECGERVEATGLDAFGDAFIAHVRSVHTDWPYPDMAIRNFAEATQRLSDRTDRVPEIGEITVYPVTEVRLDDWLAFFDHDAFADKPEWAACYCSEPHLLQPGTQPEPMSWRDRRQSMIELLRAGRSFGYLAYVDGRPAGWVNASKRSEYAMFRRGPDAAPADTDVVGISCFVIAPPYRRHQVATRLLERVVADATDRGVSWLEAYPFNGVSEGDAANFRGTRSMFESHGFAAVKERAIDTVMQRRVT